MKKKWIIILAAVLLVALVVIMAVMYVMQRRTTALELLPEEAWEGNLTLCFAAEEGVYYDIDFSSEQLHAVLEDANLWHVSDRRNPGYPKFWVHFRGINEESWMYIGANGATMNGKRYIQVAESDAETFWRMFNGERNEPQEVTEFEYYLDDGSLYQALLVLMEEAGVQTDS